MSAWPMILRYSVGLPSCTSTPYGFFCFVHPCPQRSDRSFQRRAFRRLKQQPRPSTSMRNVSSDPGNIHDHDNTVTGDPVDTAGPGGARGVYANSPGKSNAHDGRLSTHYLLWQSAEADNCSVSEDARTRPADGMPRRTLFPQQISGRLTRGSVEGRNDSSTGDSLLQHERRARRLLKETTEAALEAGEAWDVGLDKPNKAAKWPSLPRRRFHANGTNSNSLSGIASKASREAAIAGAKGFRRAALFRAKAAAKSASAHSPRRVVLDPGKGMSTTRAASAAKEGRETGGEPFSVTDISDLDQNPVAESYERGRWLLGLLILQSTSSFVLDKYQDLLREHVVVTLFLTMLVGAGGNAGNQSAIKVIRGLATGRFTADMTCALKVIGEQAIVGLLLGAALAAGGFTRVWVTDGTTLRDAAAISMSLFLIVMTSVLLGSMLPFGFAKAGVDPAHAGTSIQVAMDIVGVAVTCVTCSLVLSQLDQAVSSAVAAL